MLGLIYLQDDAYKQLEDAMASAISEKNSELVQQHEDHENTLKEQRDKLLDMRTRKETEYAALKQDYDEKCQEMASALTAQSEEFFDKEKELREELKQQEVDMNKEREDQLATLRAEHEEAMRKAAEDLEMAMSQRDDEFLRMKENQEDKYRELTEQMRQMADAHEQQLTKRVFFVLWLCFIVIGFCSCVGFA